MKFLIAIQNQKIYEELKKDKNIHIISNNISYKEGIIEILEKNRNIQYILFSEKLNGNLSIEKLIQKIKKINSEIKIILIIKKIDNFKKDFLLKNKINYFLEEEVTSKKIIEKVKRKKSKIIAILGNSGSGKTVTTGILAELLRKNKKILIIENAINDKSIQIFFNKEKESQQPITEIKNNIFLLNIKKFFSNNLDKKKILYKINQIKNNYDYILIDVQKTKEYFLYQEIINENLLLLNANILEINKIKKFINNSQKQFSVILNFYNSNCISDEIIKKTFKNKIKIIAKIKYSSQYNTIINHQFNFLCLNKNTKKEFLKIIKTIQ